MRIKENIKTTNLNKREFGELVQKIADRTYIRDSFVIEAGFLYPGGRKEHSEAFTSLISALKQNPHIKKISLVNQNINDEDTVLLSKVTTLEEINLENNSVRNKGTVSLASNPNIKVLSLKSNTMNALPKEGFQEIANALCKNKTIVELNLSMTQRSYLWHDRIIKENTTIKILDLSETYIKHCHLGGIEHNKTLQYLNLSRNKLCNDAAEVIAKNSSLHTLIIDDSEITNKGGEYLSTHPSLKVLSIIDSNMTAEGLRCFLSSNLEKVTPDNINKNLITELELCEFYREFEIMHRVADAEEVTEMGGAVDTLGSEII